MNVNFKLFDKRFQEHKTYEGSAFVEQRPRSQKIEYGFIVLKTSRFEWLDYSFLFDTNKFRWATWIRQFSMLNWYSDSYLFFYHKCLLFQYQYSNESCCWHQIVSIEQ
jgi:hypothetical protein